MTRVTRPAAKPTNLARLDDATLVRRLVLATRHVAQCEKQLAAAIKGRDAFLREMQRRRLAIPE